MNFRNSIKACSIYSISRLDRPKAQRTKSPLGFSGPKGCEDPGWIKEQRAKYPGSTGHLLVKPIQMQIQIKIQIQIQIQIQNQNIQEGLLLGQTDGQRSAGPTGLCGLRLNVPFPCDHDRGFT